MRVRLAEARKIEAETAEIEVRIEERRLRMELLALAVLTSPMLLTLALVLAAFTSGHGALGGEGLTRLWLPSLLPKP